MHVDPLQWRLVRVSRETFIGVESWTVEVAVSESGGAVLGVKLIMEAISVVGGQVCCWHHLWFYA